MKVATILGTRPELIKMSEIIKKLDKHTNHILIHTGQNYDFELGGIFYEELGVRKPDYVCELIGDNLHEKIASIIAATGEVLAKEKPNAVVILGDTNSSLAAYMAKRLKIPVFHLEAGNRCFDDNVPEEVNRRIIDHISDVNMVYSENSRQNLIAEGIARDRIFTMGSPMQEIIDTHAGKIAKSDILPYLGVDENKYFVASIHREENVDNTNNLSEIVKSLNKIATLYNIPVILSAHPRMLDRMEKNKFVLDDRVIVHKPFGFFDYMKLQMNSKCVISDSGTISEESSIMGFPAITLRNTIERPEVIDVGGMLITSINMINILDCLKVATSDFEASPTPTAYDIDNCSDRVLKTVLSYTPYVNRYVWNK
ncbi:UDP-N-acetylglucosamine 2-epimerase (non-hydrolyzing) [Candidatus Saccharibacteria bacterium]|nr:UDP-N-acetylglucosamine 2-epimerase (non-hydrolyzing) [Candidatus Saccharibacteria bacterium]